MRAPENHQICCDMGIRRSNYLQQKTDLVVDSKLSLTKQFIGAACNEFQKNLNLPLSF
jgi:hypothetical protein